MRWSQLSLVDLGFRLVRSRPETARNFRNIGIGLHFRVTLFGRERSVKRVVRSYDGVRLVLQSR